MGTSCSGCIEVWGWTNEPERADDDERWGIVVTISPWIFERHYPLFCRLFGIRCGAGIGDASDAIAPRRGLPPLLSYEGEQLLRWREDISWATADEVARAVAELGLEPRDDWGLRYVLDSLKLFGEKFGGRRARLVLGFW